MDVVVLDTNVMLSDPHAIFQYPNCKVIIPTVVISEIDSKKRLMDELGRNARVFSRLLDDLSKQGSLIEGVSLENGSVLAVHESPSTSPVFGIFDDQSKDTMIVAVAHHIRPCTLISRDILVRIKANVMGVKTDDFTIDKVIDHKDESYAGYTVHYENDERINQFFQQKYLPFEGLEPNHFYVLKSFDERKSALTIYKNKSLSPLYHLDDDVWGISAKNVEQKMAIELLLDPDVKLVTISGKAGTGKTLLALAAALKQTLDDRRYLKLLVARPVVPMGKDIGYLPGDLNDKLRPWMQPIYDNLEFLFNCKTRNDLDKILIGMQSQIQVEALTYIRGRSIPKQFIIIDEAQNLTKHEAKTILTRVGEGSKIVLVGDPDQIDHPYLDAYSNGLTYIIEKLKSISESGHVTLKRGERSTLAQICADLL